MKSGFATPISRRSLLMAGSALIGASMLPLRLHAAPGAIVKTLAAAPGRTALVGAPYPDTDVWCYSGHVPGPELRLRQGDRVLITVENRLQEETTVHWHGVRVPNAMDGVPTLTQKPIAPGESFVYEFDLPDAGTYWYHPHAHSAEQVGRGLAGALVVEERDPLPVDRDIVWVLGDWRLKEDATIAGGFNSPMEMLEFKDHQPLVIALDGQAIEPHPPERGRVVLGPAMRTDLVLDMSGEPGSSAAVIDSFYEGLSYKLVDVAYTAQSPLRAQPLAAPTKLPPNTMPEPDIANAQRHDVTLTGGMMGGMGMGGMMGGMGMGSGMRGMMGGGAMWAINGVAVSDDDMAHMKPILTLRRGKSYILAINNETAWYHPVHLHGHLFRVITRNGRRTTYQEWRDTVLIPPRERAAIAFVADNPGDWMFHCHILDHQEGGMMSVIRVT